MEDLKITIIQTSLYWENVDENLHLFDHKISGITEQTDLIILPEMFNSGFTMNTKLVAERMNGKTMQWMSAKAREKNAVITGSLIIKENEKYFNRLVWMNPSGTYRHYDKRHLFRMGEEQHHFSAGDKKMLVNLKGWKICPLICYDLRFPVWSRNGKGTNEYDLLLYVANWPERRNHAWKILLTARAIENQCYVAGLNRIGKDGNDITHSGDSTIINAKGEIISRVKANEDVVETVTLSHQELDEFRKLFPVSLDADDFLVNIQ